MGLDIIVYIILNTLWLVLEGIGNGILWLFRKENWKSMNETGNCTCGKRLCNDAELTAWHNRPYCKEQGDCKCPVCSEVCWDINCGKDDDGLESKE